MMLDVFTEPDTVTCILCRATVSIRKGDKARFFNHISLDHEVHYDMELFYVVSFLSQDQIETVIDIISDKVKGQTEDAQEDVTLEEACDLSEESEAEHKLEENIKREKAFDNHVESTKESFNEEPSSPSYLQIIQKHFENTNNKANTSPDIRGDETASNSNEKAVKPNGADDLQSLPKKEEESLKAKEASKKKLKPQANRHEVIPCSLCDKRLRRDNLKRHLNIVHKIGKAEQEKLNLDDIEGTETPNNLKDNAETQEPVIKKEKLDFASIIINKIKANESPKKQNTSSFKKCKLCSKMIKRSYYIRHQRRHKKEQKKSKPDAYENGANEMKAVTCELCCLSFSRRERLLVHLKNIHENEVNLLDKNLLPKFTKEECNFDCKECALKFISETSLSYHVKRKHGTGSFVCEYCSFKLCSEVRRKGVLSFPL